MAKGKRLQLSPATRAHLLQGFNEIKQRQSAASKALSEIAPDVPFPSSTEEWKQLASRCGMPLDRMMRGDWTAADIWPGVRGYFEARQDRTASRRPAAQINAPGLACRPPSSLVNGELIANVQPLTCMLLEHMIHVGECLEDDAIVAAWGANAQPTTCAVDAQVRKANHALLAVKAAKSMSRKGGYIILS